MKIKLGTMLEELKQRHKRWEQATLDDFDDELSASIQFLQIWKTHLLELEENLKGCCNVLRLFVFNSGKFDLNLSNRFCYPFFLTNKTLNLLSSRKLTTLYRSIFRY